MDAMKLLVVEDEEHIGAGLKLNLELEGHDAMVCRSAREGLETLMQYRFDLILLDVMLPDMSGFEACQKLREVGNFTPVIMLTARSEASDRVAGLDAGADDYVPKPFDFQELLARIRSTVRRRQWDRSQQAPTQGLLKFGEVSVNFETHEVKSGQVDIKLTQLELDLLKYFYLNAGRVLSREELLEQVWKLRNYPNTRTVDNFIVRLRKHFEADAKKPRYFVSHRGSGYKFVKEP